MFEINGRQYELKYTMKRIELIERVTDMPVMAAMQKFNGMMSVANLKIYLGYALREVGTDTVADIKDGMKMAEKLIESNDFIKLNGAVLEALQDDCPFFFPAD